MAQIDNTKLRMPAILKREQRESWLLGSAESAASGLSAYPDESMVAYPVSSRVDSRCNNDENLVEPLETDVD